MYLKPCVLIVIFGFVFCAERNTPCVTPNKENGTCIPVNSCRPIKQAIMYFDQDAIEFARKSQCGDDDGPLVCCGTVGRVTDPPGLRPPTTLPSIEIYIPSVATPIDNIYLPDSSLCGLQIPENKAARGVAEVFEFPWLAALFYIKDDDGTPGGFRCSGTLINRRYVLTAAQCLHVPGFNLTKVRLGEWKFSAPKVCVENPYNDDECEHPVIDLKVVESTAHPYFNAKSGNNDIALLRLESEVKFNDYVRPICLPPSDYLPPPAGSRMGATGWALTETGTQSDQKLKAEVSMVGSEECNKVFPNFVQENPNKACVRSEGPKWCSGDSGGPIMRSYDKEDEDDQQQRFQEGIIYKGIGCGEKGSPALYMRVSRYIHWILSNLKPSK